MANLSTPSHTKAFVDNHTYIDTIGRGNHRNFWKRIGNYGERHFQPLYATARDMHLHQPLDNWLVKPTQWPWLHNTTTNKLYHCKGLLYQEFLSQALRLTRYSTYSKIQRTNWNHPDPNQRPVAVLPPGQYQVVNAYKRF
jgi:hypothetical protein